MNIKLGKIILILGSIVVLILLAPSTGGKVWFRVELKSGVTLGESGLWKTCAYNRCSNITEIPDWLKAVRAFAIISILACIAGIMIAILGLFNEKVKGLFATIFFFATGVCMIIALGIYTDKKDKYISKPGVSFGWSYIVGWIGALGAFVSGIVGILAERF